MTDRRERFLDEVLREMRRGFPHGVERSGGALSTGLTMSSGRAVGIYVDGAQTVYRITDGGDAWSDPVVEGYADAVPSLSERETLQRACELHGAPWDAERREVVTIAESASAVAAAATRVAAVVLAIDGWRAWYPRRKTRNAQRKRLVRHIVHLAPYRGWVVDMRTPIQGKRHKWQADTVLARMKRQAAIEITTERNAEHVIQRTVGFLHDVTTTGLVLVVPRKVEAYVRGSAELRDRVAIVDKLPIGSARALVEAAERAVVAA
ncbi:MAG: hypothetical protein JST00_46045 [Deltaproteobacteria bacterium]|nr:hypothetical protein [Deltaproteobacteria bacterium]